MLLLQSTGGNNNNTGFTFYPKLLPCDSVNRWRAADVSQVHYASLRIVRIGPEKATSYLTRCEVSVDLLVAHDEAPSCFLPLQN